MKICKGGITRNIDEKRWPEFSAKGYKQVEETKDKKPKDEKPKDKKPKDEQPKDEGEE